MKLIRKSNDRLTFRMSRREKAALTGLLKLYPVLPAAHHRSVSGKNADDLAGTQKLLEEALREQTEENKTRVRKFLEDEQRFQDSDPGVLFHLQSTEVEWYLQTLNDIRVGSWVNAGSPHPHEPISELNEAKLRALWAMETTGMLQHQILTALNGGDESPA